ncbi:MAG: hypothetical protein ACT4NY_12055 [Pseudonocardiales bacterium]
MTGAPNGKTPREPNNVLAECRAALRLSHEKLAYLMREKARDRGIQIGTLDSVTRHIKRIEAGHVRDPSAVYKALLCAALQKNEAFLFGAISLEASSGSMSARTFNLRNHKLIPTFVGASAVQRAIDNLAMQAAPTSPTRCYHYTLNHPRDEVGVELWVWPFGVAIFHLIEDVAFPDLANFALWHRRVYDEQVNWANETIASLFKSDASAQYAMPINWVVRSIWSKSDLDTALRILTAPRLLLQRTAHTESSDLAHAALVERSLFQGGLDQFDVSEFGIEGISMGIASWSGVVYFPIAPHRALLESEVLTYELTVQAAWSYCDWIRSQVEIGNDLDVEPQHGRRLLRALRSIITNPRPEESAQIYPLRIAILGSSGITEHLNQATDAIAELRG